MVVVSILVTSPVVPSIVVLSTIFSEVALEPSEHVDGLVPPAQVAKVLSAHNGGFPVGVEESEHVVAAAEPAQVGSVPFEHLAGPS